MAKFIKGTSGNPNGRPRGIPDKRTVYRETLHENAPEIIGVLIEKAISGDSVALRICTDRILPSLKAGDATINIQLSGDLSEQGQQVLSALGNGQLSPAEAGSVFNSLQSQSRLIESDEIIERIEALEKALKR